MVAASYIPQDLTEALRLRKETGAHPLAGGTDLMVSHRRGTGVVPTFPWPVMIVSQLEELKGIRMDGREISIGACATCGDISQSGIVPWQVRKAASLMGAQSLRNLATIGGNICNASPKGDLPVPLIMLDARVELVSASAARQMLLDEFIIGPKETALHADELLTRVIIPKTEPPFTYTWYRKIGTRRANAISKLSLCAAITVDGKGVITDFRAVSGAAGPKAARNREVERMLIGLTLSEMGKQTASFLDAYNGIISPHAMPEYRRLSTRQMLEHFLGAVVERPAGCIIE